LNTQNCCTIKICVHHCIELIFTMPNKYVPIAQLSPEEAEACCAKACQRQLLRRQANPVSMEDNTAELSRTALPSTAIQLPICNTKSPSTRSLQSNNHAHQVGDAISEGQQPA
jgi:hypothetical protein